MDGRPMAGTWYAQTKEYEARRQAKRKSRSALGSWETTSKTPVTEVDGTPVCGGALEHIQLLDNRRVHDQLIAALALSQWVRLAETLDDLKRDRLKDSCRTLSIGDFGRANTMIIERLAGKLPTACGRAPAKGSAQTTLDPGEITTATPQPSPSTAPNGKLDRRPWSAADKCFENRSGLNSAGLTKGGALAGKRPPPVYREGSNLSRRGDVKTQRTGGTCCVEKGEPSE